MIAKRVAAAAGVPCRHAPMRRRDVPDPQPLPADARPSKTRRKQAMHELQDLGEALVALDPPRLAALGLPERLVEAVTLARRITAHEGRRRQIQFIGRLMRDVDPAPIRAAIEASAALSHEDRARFAAAEAWRDRLLAEDAALTEFVVAHPGVDREELAKMVGDARAERAAGRPPHRFRALFRLVSRTLDVA